MTKQVAKLIMIDQAGKYLLMYRSNHPVFGNDPDIPGGTHEDGETIDETVVREVFEETGVQVNEVQLLHRAASHAGSDTTWSVYVAHVNPRPEIVMSWEHGAYEWISREAFLIKAKGANDSFMRMVYDAAISYDTAGEKS